jgi:Uma2 family endonuclease
MWCKSRTTFHWPPRRQDRQQLTYNAIEAPFRSTPTPLIKRFTMAVRLAPPHRFTRDEYHLMAKVGILKPDARVELIDGEIVEMSPIGRRHNGSVDTLAEVLIEGLERRANVRVQGSITLGEHGEPQPDIVVLRRRADFYRSADAGPEDVLLIIEVADSSEGYDRLTKAPLYALFQIPELWIADLNRDRVGIYRDPTPTGYATVQVARRGETISPLAFPDLQIAVDAILG